MSAKIKILDIINTSAAAKELLVRRVEVIQRDGRFENWIACGPGRHLRLLDEKDIPYETIDSPRGISLRYVSPAKTASALWCLVRLIRRERFHVVHTHGVVQGVLGRVAACICRTPVIMHLEHGSLYFDAQSPWERWFYKKLDRAAASVTDHLIYQNRLEMEFALREHLTGRARAHFIGTGVDLSLFRPSLRSTVEDPKRKKIIINVARPDPIKNHAMLLKAVDRLRHRYQDFELWILGEGILDAELQKWVATRGLGKWVRFWGYRDDVAELIAQADIGVLTSRKEGVPRGLMEPMAMGLPVVATCVKGSRDVVADGESGFLVGLDDVDALTDRLHRLLEDPKLRRTMGACAVSQMRERFDEAKAIERLIEIYAAVGRSLIPDFDQYPVRPCSAAVGAHGTL